MIPKMIRTEIRIMGALRCFMTLHLGWIMARQSRVMLAEFKPMEPQ